MLPNPSTEVTIEKLVVQGFLTSYTMHMLGDKWGNLLEFLTFILVLSKVVVHKNNLVFFCETKPFQI